MTGVDHEFWAIAIEPNASALSPLKIRTEAPRTPAENRWAQPREPLERRQRAMTWAELIDG